MPKLFICETTRQSLGICDFNCCLVNGTLGEVIDFDSERQPVVEFEGVGVKTVQPDYFVIPGRYEGAEPLAQRIQYPIALAFAMSIHKSQGQSLARCIVDMGTVFEYGQAYVAISRCVSLKGLKVKGFSVDRIKVCSKVVDFYNRLK